jgi:hypothetical protein
MQLNAPTVAVFAAAAAVIVVVVVVVVVITTQLNTFHAFLLYYCKAFPTFHMDQ